MSGPGAARVVVVGQVAVDRSFFIDRFPEHPVKVRAHAYRESGGGMAASASVAIAALGGKATFWGRVGDDADGHIVLGWLRDRGVDVADIRPVAGAHTPASAVLIDAAGERLLAGFQGKRLGEEPGWLPLGKVDHADAVLADVRWPAGAEALFVAARAGGVPCVLDADVGDPAALARLLPLADHAIFSARGLQELTGIDDPARALLAVEQRVHGTLAVTIGRDGCLWREDEAVLHLPAFAVDVHDSNGAGDAFHGAFTLAVAEAWQLARKAAASTAAAEAAMLSAAPFDVHAALRFAAAAAAVKCERGRGWDAMPDRTAVEKLLRG